MNPNTTLTFERKEHLDPMAEALWEVLPDWELTGWSRGLLADTRTGRSLGPLLTDFALVCWSSASVRDLLDRRRSAGTARRLAALGLLASLLAAAAGQSERRRSERRAHRFSVACRYLNTLALVLYGAAYVARRRGSGSGGSP